MVKRAGTKAVQKQKQPNGVRLPGGQSQSTKQTNKQSVKVNINLEQAPKRTRTTREPRSDQQKDVSGRMISDYSLSPIHPIYRPSSESQPIIRSPTPYTLGSSRTLPMEQLTPSRNIFGQSPQYLHNSEQNLPTQIATAYPISYVDQPSEPARIKQNAGSYVPSTPIYKGPNPADVDVYEQPLRDFAENKAYNELLRQNQDMQSAIENSTRDAYNLYLNTTDDQSPTQEDDDGRFSRPSIGDDIPPYESPAFYEPEDEESAKRARGRPYSKFTDDDIRILEEFIRISTTTKSKDRTLLQQQSILDGRRLISNKRANPNLKPIIVGIRARLEDEKK